VAEQPVDTCHGECLDAACCNTAQQSCDTPGVYVQASAHDAPCSVKRSPTQSAQLSSMPALLLSMRVVNFLEI